MITILERTYVPMLLSANERIAARLNRGSLNNEMLDIRRSAIAHPLGAIDEEVGMMMKEMEVVDPSSIKRDLLFEKGLPLDRTGSWIFDLPQLDENEGNSRNRDDRAAATTYTQWRSDEDSPVLLIFGRPGAGKTMLLISLIDEIHSDIPPNELFAYFFIIAARDDRNTAVSVVKSLIWQIILQQPSLARHVMHKYKIQGAQVLFTSLSALWGVLDDIVSDTALYRAYFAIDALDECQLDSLKGFLRHLDLSIDPRAKNRTHWHKIKWLFTSRDEPTVRESLHSALLVDLEKNSIHVDKAVDEYITLEVQELNKKKNYSSNLRKYVEDYIRKYANGTFLWVWLACKELAKPEILRSESKGVLLDLPPGLVPLYGRILRRITDLENPKSISVVIRILSTVLVSARPLRLRELAIAANLPETSRGNEEDILDYVRQCGSLLIIPPSDYLQSAGVSFVHQSVKDYLAPTYCPEPGFCWNSTNSGPMYCQAPESCECPKKCLSEGDYPRSAMRQTPLFPINISKAHSALAKACLEYVAANVINAGQDHNFNIASSSGEVHRGLPQALQKEFPFIDYASFFWPVHSRVPSPDIEAVMESKCVSELFAPGSTKGVVWLKRYEKLKHRKIPRKTHTLDRFYSLYVASYIGVLPLVKRVLELGADIGSSALHIAIQCEHVEIVDFLMEKGANPEVEQGVFGNLLKTAVHTKNQDLVRTMIERGANIDAQGLNYGNALYEAASSGDEGMVLLLLNLHADINAQGNRLGTALYAAAFNNHLSVLELLLKRQAMVNLQGGTFGNALQGAVSQSNARSVRLLINHNADVNAYGGRYHTALMAAVTRNSEEIVLMLLDAGADPYLGWSDHLGQRSKNRSTLMSWAVERRSEPVIRNLLAKDFLPTAEECLSIAQKGYIDLVKFCLDQGVALDLDATLENAAKNDSKAVVQLLLARGLDVTAQNGLVALNSAAKAGSIDTLELLLHSGVAVEGEKGKMAVELAAEARSANAVERLLKHGASSSYDALYSGAFGGNLGIVELLLATATPLQPDAGQHSNLIEAAVLGGNQQVVKLLLERGADVNLPGSTYGSALHAAVFKGSPSIVHLLLEYGANVNGPNDAYGCALQRAAYMGNVSIVSLLLRRGANVNSTGGRCGSPLQAAAYVNSDAVLKLLLDRDADPNAAASSGRTVLQAAIDWRDIGATLPDHTLNPNVGIPSCSVEIVSLLLDRGADAKAKGGRFGNALAAAVHWGLVEVARLLVEKGAVARPDGQVWVDAIEEAERNRATFQRDVDEDDVLMSMMVG